MTALGSECVCMEYDQLAILAKIESAYSDDSLPAPAEAVLFTGRPTVTIEGQVVERDIAKPYWGNDPHQLTSKFVTITGEVEVTGAGAAGDIPGSAVLLQICGLAQTQNIGVDVQYDPASDGIESATIYFHENEHLWKIVGARGNVKLMMSAGNIAKWQYTITGLFSVPSQAALPALPTFTDSVPLVLNYNNTPTSTFFGQTADVNNFEFDLGNVISKQDKPGCYAVQIKGRKSIGSITICATDLGVWNPYDVADKYQTGTAQIVHGVDAGAIVQADVSKIQLQLEQISKTDLGSNETGFVMPFKSLPFSADDEAKFTFK